MVTPLLSLLLATYLIVPRSTAPAGDSLTARLGRDEAAATSPRAAGDAALTLGRLRYARGEYRPAADAFSRAAARLEPARKPEALYWAGLSWLGLGSASQARALLEEVAASASPRRNDAMLGIAVAWQQLGRPDQAYATLERLLGGDPGEAGPAALERFAALADRFHRPREAERARARLLADYPASIEAAMAAADMKNAGAPPASGPVTLEAGRFVNSGRAKGLVARAARAGFTDARVVERGEGAARVFTVVLGAYPDASTARKAQARAARVLGLSARMTGDR